MVVVDVDVIIFHYKNIPLIKFLTTLVNKVVFLYIYVDKP